MKMDNLQVAYLTVLLASWCSSIVYCVDHPDGVSSVSREQDALGNYRFSYSVANHEGEHFRKEGTDELGRVIGSYGLKHIDGTHRVVDYVADKDGFRAEVRSNEPGMVHSDPGDSHLLKTVGADTPLTVAATSNDDARSSFGKRLHADVSRVAYVSSIGEEKTPDETVRESRQRNFDDYRPLSPVAYYPGDERSPQSPPIRSVQSPPIRSVQSPPIRNPIDHQRTPRVLQQTPEVESKPLDVYFPPIDPHSGRRPAYYPSRDRDADRNSYPTTTSRRPFIPPYGGFDDEPQLRRPGISMSTIHGGFGIKKEFPVTEPTSSYRFPPVRHAPDQRPFGNPRIPPGNNFPNPIPGPSNGVLPSFPRGMPSFNPPSYEGGMGSPNFVLRAVPIPNGIQAVRVDPTSGRVYERLMYPLFLSHDGHPAYDRNILLHNDELGDDDVSRNFDNSGNFDIPFPDRPFRGVRNPTYSNEDRPGRSGQYNGSHSLDERTLDQPTARDLEWIHRQLSQVEGFERNAFDNRIQPNSQNRDSSFQIDEDSPPFRNYRPSSRLRSFPDVSEFVRSDSDIFSRNPRNSDVLAEDDSKAHPKILAESDTHSKQIETEGKSSSIEKE